ncbi:MAG: hypothetical protein IJ219_06820 [Bacteroidaceae bacterium]|nr:hypothetical protein [Bacteroidaceae bacterium]MBQ9294624.1 hypothetical protein [Bacteroidaceae bacterium]
MKKPLLSAILLSMITFGTTATEWHPGQWPTLKHYDQNHLFQIALPLGGIGTGQVSLGGRGELRDWEIMNIPAKGFSTVYTGSSNAPFFAIYTKPADGEARTTLLEGPIYAHEYVRGGGGEEVNHHGMPRFSDVSFDAAYPFGQVNLSDQSLPVKVRIKGFNPLVPAAADDSSLPVAVLAYEVTNTKSVPVEVAVCGTMRNFIGRDGRGNSFAGCKNNKNVFREADGLRGIYFYSDSVDHNDPAWGTMALVTTGKEGVTFRTCSKPNAWQNAILNFWDDFSADGLLTDKEWPLEADPMASLAVKKRIAAGGTETFVFYLTWDFPNRKAWSQTVVGNYYSTLYEDAWDAARKIVPQIPRLENETRLFVNSFLGSSYPEEVKEAALFNLSALRSQTTFRIPSGHLMGWEGVWNRSGSCKGTCTHVWNYEVSTPFLFGELAKTMRDVEFNYATKPNGLMNFRADLPLSEAAKRSAPAADGQMGCIMKMYREWQLSGDNKFLADNWEQVKKVLSYAWLADNGIDGKGSWDANQDGVMEGSQHNTMDVNYFGPNPQMGFWYMGALRAAEEMAKAMKDKAFAKKCHNLFVKGSAWMDKNLFNGEYYEHKITSPETFEFLDMDNPETKVPDFQLGRGCLVDQLVGQYMAHICGLGYLADKEHIRQTLQSIMKYNWLDDFGRHFNNMRTFVYAGESGLVMGSWPKGRLEVPFPYFAEAMTGFEYTAAVGMLYEGLTSDGLKCFRAVRNRFDGAKRNPFSEPECGHHYSRAMAAWAGVLALSGFHYSAVDQHITFTDKPGHYFWSTGYAWGTCDVKADGTAKLDVLKGELPLKTITVGNKTMTYKTPQK